jgi:hypothetical protein
MKSMNHPLWRDCAAAFLGALSFCFISVSGAFADQALSRTVGGIHFISFIPETDRIDGIPTTPADVAMERMVLAVETVVKKVPMVGDRLAALKKKGDIEIYYDARHPRDVLATVSLATYFADYYDPAAGKRTFVILFGRAGIQWDANHLASTIAHELAGHAYQDMQGRLEGMTELDAECEAYLVEEHAKQALDYDKTTDEAIALRNNMDHHWCDDFRRYTLEKDRAVSTEWDELNPNIPKLLAAFQAYQKAR